MRNTSVVAGSKLPIWVSKLNRLSLLPKRYIEYNYSSYIYVDSNNSPIKYIIYSLIGNTIIHIPCAIFTLLLSVIQGVGALFSKTSREEILSSAKENLKKTFIHILTGQPLFIGNMLMYIYHNINEIKKKEHNDKNSDKISLDEKHVCDARVLDKQVRQRFPLTSTRPFFRSI